MAAANLTVAPIPPGIRLLARRPQAFARYRSSSAAAFSGVIAS